MLSKAFTIQNNHEGFDDLFQRIKPIALDLGKVKVGLEATGHYSYNLLGFLLDKGLIETKQETNEFFSMDDSDHLPF